EELRDGHAAEGHVELRVRRDLLVGPLDEARVAEERRREREAIGERLLARLRVAALERELEAETALDLTVARADLLGRGRDRQIGAPARMEEVRLRRLRRARGRRVRGAVRGLDDDVGR